jgi:hypothetical protein
MDAYVVNQAQEREVMTTSMKCRTQQQLHSTRSLVSLCSSVPTQPRLQLSTGTISPADRCMCICELPCMLSVKNRRLVDGNCTDCVSYSKFWMDLNIFPVGKFFVSTRMKRKPSDWYSALTGLWAGRSEVQFPAGATDFILLKNSWPALGPKQPPI